MPAVCRELIPSQACLPTPVGYKSPHSRLSRVLSAVSALRHAWGFLTLNSDLDLPASSPSPARSDGRPSSAAPWMGTAWI